MLSYRNGVYIVDSIDLTRARLRRIAEAQVHKYDKDSKSPRQTSLPVASIVSIRPKMVYCEDCNQMHEIEDEDAIANYYYNDDNDNDYYNDNGIINARNGESLDDILGISTEIVAENVSLLLVSNTDPTTAQVIRTPMLSSSDDSYPNWQLRPIPLHLVASYSTITAEEQLRNRSVHVETVQEEWPVPRNFRFFRVLRNFVRSFSFRR